MHTPHVCTRYWDGTRCMSYPPNFLAVLRICFSQCSKERSYRQPLTGYCARELAAKGDRTHSPKHTHEGVLSPN